MVVKVKWFYHPEETKGGKKLQDMKVYQCCDFLTFLLKKRVLLNSNLLLLEKGKCRK